MHYIIKILPIAYIAPKFRYFLTENENRRFFFSPDFSAIANFEILRQSRINTRIGAPPPVTMLRNHYTKEVKRLRDSHKDFDFDCYDLMQQNTRLY